MSYLLLAYPELDPADYRLIQEYRKQNDKLYFNLVEPHFTIVFPVSDIEESEFLTEVTNKVRGVKKFDFILRSAVIQKDAFNDYYHAYLVPDEGYSALVKMHDRFYSGVFKDNLRLDIPFIPHIGIGNSKESSKCKEMIDEWNGIDFSIRGVVNKLDLVNYDLDKITNLNHYHLL